VPAIAALSSIVPKQQKGRPRAAFFLAINRLVAA